MKRIALFTLISMMFSCNASRVNQESSEALAPVIVYKTIANYDHLVPVTLNEAKDKIVSYPAPSDLYYKGELARPVKLKQGFLLDRRGLNANSVFTSFSYEAYSKLESPPSLQELYESIMEKEPFESMYDCGPEGNSGNLEKRLNTEIRKGMRNCKSLIE